MKPGVKFLHSLFEVTHVEFQTYDIFNHRLLFSSGIMERLLGYPHDEYIKLGDNYYKSILRPDDLESVRNTIDHLRRSKNGEVAEMTVRVRRRTGDKVSL